MASISNFRKKSSRKSIKVYFIAGIKKNEKANTREYEDYIRQVKPIVEKYGGRYKTRSDRVTIFGSGSSVSPWKPDRVILIEWDDRRQLERCFSSEEYGKIAGKRERAVSSSAIIVEEE